jgi:hypothetical protein
MLPRIVLPMGLCLAVLLFSSCSEEDEVALDFSADRSAQHLISYSGYPTDELADINAGLAAWTRLGLPARSLAPGLTPTGASGGRTLGQGVGISYGLQYIGKGYKDPGGGDIHLNYLEVPLYAMYQYPVGPGAIRAGLGPYFAYGLGGNAEGEKPFGTAADDAGYKHFDAGLSLGGGYEFNMGLSLRVSYDYGLANTISSGQDITLAKNRTLSLNVGYEFGHLLNLRHSR